MLSTVQDTLYNLFIYFVLNKVKKIINIRYKMYYLNK